VRGVIRVRRGVSWPDGKPTVGTPKTKAGVRGVHIPRTSSRKSRSTCSCAPRRAPRRSCFPRCQVVTCNPAPLGRAFDKARAAAGRPDLHFHDLRHTGAVLAAQTGATLAELMARLGHSTPGAAMRYQHAAAGRDKAIAEALSPMVT
jgi:integrase